MVFLKRSLFYLVFCGWLSWPIVSLAADKQIEHIEVPRATVATRVPVPVNHTSSVISVVKRKQMKAFPASDPSRLLGYMPGVDVTPRGPGLFTPLSIQGSSSRHVLLLYDGIPFNTQSSGQADVASALPMAGLDRLEILRGAGTSAWGSGFGGVAAFYTRSVDSAAAEPSRGEAAVSVGGYESRRERFEVSGAASGVGYLVLGEHAQSGGTRQYGNSPNREDTQQHKFYSKLTHRPGDLVRLEGSWGYLDAENNEGVYPSSLTRVQMPYEARFGKLSAEIQTGDRSNLLFVGKVNRQELVSDTYLSSTPSLLSSVQTTDTYYGWELQYRQELRDEDIWAIGYEGSSTGLKSSQMSAARDVVVHAPHTHYTLVTDAWDWDFGTRLDINEEYGDQFNPSTGFVLHPDFLKDHTVRLHVARSFGAPPLLWKYFRDVAPGLTGNNADLLPERAWSYDAGIESPSGSPIEWRLSCYRRDIADAIATVRSSEGLFIKDNHDKFREQGFVWESKWEVSPSADFLFAAGFSDVRNRLDDRVVLERGATRPNFKLGVQSSTPFGTRMNIYSSYNRWDASPSSQADDRKFIWDFQMTQAITRLGPFECSAFVNVYNIMNSKYWSNIELPTPGRFGEVGILTEF